MCSGQELTFQIHYPQKIEYTDKIPIELCGKSWTEDSGNAVNKWLENVDMPLNCLEIISGDYMSKLTVEMVRFCDTVICST